MSNLEQSLNTSTVFTHLFVSLGYVFITNIPDGATDIQIIERRKTENILGKKEFDWWNS